MRSLGLLGLRLRRLGLRPHRLLHRGLLNRRLRPTGVGPYLTGMIRVLPGRAVRSLRNHRLYRLNGAERREPLVGVGIGIVGTRTLRSEASLRPKSFVH